MNGVALADEFLRLRAHLFKADVPLIAWAAPGYSSQIMYGFAADLPLEPSGGW